MRTPSKIITALALAGMAVVGGAAFTGAGLTSTVPVASQFVGGSIDQQVLGANVDSITYGYYTGSGGLDQSKTVVNTVTVVFHDAIATGHAVTLGVAGTSATPAGTFKTVTVADSAVKTFVFTYDKGADVTLSPDAFGYIGLNNVTINVS